MNTLANTLQKALKTYEAIKIQIGTNGDYTWDQIKQKKFYSIFRDEIKKFPELTEAEQWLAQKFCENDGNFSPDQYQLFPMSTFCDIGSAVKSFQGKHGDFELALGLIYEYDCGSYHKWETVISFPRCFAGLIKYKFEKDSLTISNQEELEKLGIKFPKVGKNEDLPINWQKVVVYLKNPLIGKVLEQTENFPEQLGWWSTDFSGYGSFINEPFSTEIDGSFINDYISQIGYMAKDLKKDVENDYLSYLYKKKFLDEKIIPFMQQFEYTIADGHYTGRPLGMKRGAENHRTVTIKELKDLEVLAGLGTFIVTHKKLA